MKSNELRIGNWVMDRGDKIWQIHSWDSYEKVCANPPFLGDSDLGQITGHPLTEYVDYLKPIPLTEEWLLRFGFDESQNDKYKYFLSPIALFRGIGEETKNRFYYFRSGHSVGLEIKYVHQLQNLYFALTGEELELKEKQDA